MSVDGGILSGVRCLDFTQAVAGPLGTRVLAALGADVIKVEIPSGDLVRTMAAHQGVSAMFAHSNSAKRCISLDLKDEECMQIVRDLVAQCDVIVENWRPGVADRLGLGYAALSEINPTIVMCSVSGYGQTGPLSHLVGADPAGLAISGFTAMIGEPGEAPYWPTSGIADTSTAVNAALGIIAALFHRERTGRGQHVDIAMSDVMLFMDATNVPLAAARRGAGTIPKPGRHHPVVAPFGIFTASDGYVVIEAWGSGPESLWGRLCGVIGRPDLIDDPDFLTIDDRQAHLPELIEILEGWLATVPTRQEAVDRLVAAGVVAAPILTPEEAVAHPIYAERAMICEVPHPTIGTLPVPRVPYRFSGSDVVTERAPAIGEHNEEVLRDLLGYDAERIEALRRRGVLHEGSAWDVPERSGAPAAL